jgi:hypothetical protein
MDDYIQSPRRSRDGSGSGCGDVSEIRRGGGERLSGVESAEREDLDDREADIEFGVAEEALFTTKTGRKPLIVFFVPPVFSVSVCLCREPLV